MPVRPDPPFLAFTGPREDLPRWREMVAAHSSWTGLDLEVEHRDCDGGVVVAHTGDRAGDTTLARRLGSPGPPSEAVVAGIWGAGDPAWASAQSLFTASLSSGEVRVALEPTDPAHLFHARQGSSHLFADDLRFFARALDPPLDPAAVYALLQHGAVPPPMTPFEGVRRVPGGHLLTLAKPGDEPDLRPLYTAGPEGDGADGDPAQAVREALDEGLRDLPGDAVLFFSGGVDSGLIAARLRALGRRDVVLFNYSFGPGDTEAAHARRFAQQLGLPFEQETFDPDAMQDVLARAGDDYTFPFCDASVVPTNLLVHASLPALERSRAAIDGTGADGAFAIWPKPSRWRPLYRIPAPLRRAVGALYRTGRFWEREGRTEAALRAVRCASQMPLACAAITAQNPLSGVLYDIPADSRRLIEGTLLDNVRSLGPGLDDEKFLSLVDLVHVCAGEYAPKTYDPLRLRGVAPYYPYLDSGLLARTFALPWNDAFKQGEAKGVLKSLLAECVPRELVYRPKSGFAPPFARMFSHPATRELIGHTLLGPDPPLGPFVERGALEGMVEAAREGRLNLRAYNALWALLFSAAWLTGVRGARSAAVPAPSGP